MSQWRNTINTLNTLNNKLNSDVRKYEIENSMLQQQLKGKTIENDDMKQQLSREFAYVINSYHQLSENKEQISYDNAIIQRLNTTVAKDDATIAELNAALQTALTNQNAELDAEIEYLETRNLLNFKSSEYQRLQIGYLESLIYVCKFAYLALFLLALGLVAYKAQLRAASNLCALAFFFLFPFCVLYLEIILTNVCIWILSFATGSVYLPVQTHFNNATRQYKGAAALTATQTPM